MLDKIFALFGRDASADEKANIFAEILGMLLDYVLGYIGVEAE